MGQQNLSFECAKAARHIDEMLGSAKKQELEKLCTDAMAVLSANGPYAFFLYLWSRADKLPGKVLSQEMFRFLAPLAFPGTAPAAGEVSRDAMMRQMAELGGDLNRLLLTKKIAQEAMTYLRYHVKARLKEERGGGGRE